jgi:hypothetical protein
VYIKVIPIILVFLLVMGGVAYSLDFSYGFKGELLFCGFSGGHPTLNGYTGEDSNGVALGGFTKLSYEDILSIQPELLFSIKGDKFKHSVTKEKISLTQFYIEIPVLFTVSFPLPTSLYIAPKVFTGPYFGIHLYSMGKVKDMGIDIKPFDFGIVVGMGVEVHKIIFELSHSVGLTPVSGSLEYDTHFITIGIRL